MLLHAGCPGNFNRAMLRQIVAFIVGCAYWSLAASERASFQSVASTLAVCVRACVRACVRSLLSASVLLVV